MIGLNKKNNMSLTFSGQFFMAMVLDSHAPNEFHVMVWQRAQPELYARSTQLKVKGSNDRYHKAIAFERESDFHDFNKWWNDYKLLVGSAINSRALPEPGEGEVITGVFSRHQVSDKYRHIPNPDEFLDDWAWIVSTCSSRVWWTSSHWIFESQEEAVMFKLRGDSRRKEVDGDHYESFTSTYQGDFDCEADLDDYDRIERKSLEDLIHNQINKSNRHRW